MFATKKIRLSVIAATLLTFSLISSTAHASANSVPQGQDFGFATCCGRVITIINGGEYEVGQLLRLDAFVEMYLGPQGEPGHYWTLNLGASAEIIRIVGSGNWIDFDELEIPLDPGVELKTPLTNKLIEYGIVGTTLYVSYEVDRVVATSYSAAIFSVSGVRNKVTAPALRQTTNLSFDQSQHGTDTLSDPDGQLRKTIDSINAKYGNLISIK